MSKREYSKRRYIDAWGDIWERRKMAKNICVVRLKDGNIGGWFDGEGLEQTWV